MVPKQAQELVFLRAGTRVDDGAFQISEVQKDLYWAAGTSGCSGGIFVFPMSFPDILAGRLCHHFIDNEGAYYSLMSGYSDKADCSLVIHQYHLQILKLKCYPWLGFVYSGDNLSDLPSRGEFGLVERLGATFRTAVMPNLVGWDNAGF